MSTSKAAWVPAALLMAMPIALAGGAPDAEQTTSTRVEVPRNAARTIEHPGATAADLILSHAQVRMIGDLAALQTYRPGYAFWQHVFTIPDGAIAYGSAGDGRLLAVFPAKGDWTRTADWQEAALATVLKGQRLPSPLDDRRDLVARLIETDAGPVLHNPTRGGFLLPNVDRYAGFLSEWAAIYERFGVPGELGLAQAVVESGLKGTVRSEARAIGFCQWLASNWNRLKKLSPHVIEGYNQTTQAPYCAAYLAVLATKYGSYIPALSEHHAGGTNIGRLLINGERLGAADVRTQYLEGAEFIRDLRLIAPRSYRDVYGTYGPRSFFYAEMVFGNTFTVRKLRDSVPQRKIHAMRTRRALTLSEITRKSGLSADEVRRYNPALTKAVPARADVYLPRYMSDFGSDVAFWHRAPNAAFATALHEFLQMNATPEEWDSPAFGSVLRQYEARFRATKSEEGTVMATVLAYLRDDIETSGRGAILAEFRSSERVRRLFDQAVVERNGARKVRASAERADGTD